MLKFRKVMMGTAPPVNYRFEVEFESEELRQKWISSPALCPIRKPPVG